MENTVKINEVNPSFTNRRSFLKMSGLSLVGTGLLLSGCNNDENGNLTARESSAKGGHFPGKKDGLFDLGGGDLTVTAFAPLLTASDSTAQTPLGLIGNIVNVNNAILTFCRTQFTAVAVRLRPRCSRC